MVHCTSINVKITYKIICTYAVRCGIRYLERPACVTKKIAFLLRAAHVCRPSEKNEIKPIARKMISFTLYNNIIYNIQWKNTKRIRVTMNDFSWWVRGCTPSVLRSPDTALKGPVVFPDNGFISCRYL